MSSLKPTSPADTTFTSVQFALPYPPGIERHFWNYARNRIIERHVRPLVAKFRSNEMLVLDVGCGPGIVVDHLRRAGIDCHGVELGHPQVCPGLEDYVTIDLEADQLPVQMRQRVGIILLLDVLEHIEDPAAFVSGLQAAFPNLEHVIVTVPARMELWSNYDEFYGHFLRYDKNAFLQLARNANLHVATLKYLFIGLYPVMWLLSRLVGSRNVETAPPSGIAALVHLVIGRFFLVEERLAFLGSIPGTSLMGVLSSSAPSAR